MWQTVPFLPRSLAMPKRTVTVFDDEAKEECRQLLAKQGVRKKNEPLDEERLQGEIKQMIKEGLLVESYELDPETGRYEQVLELTELGQREAEKYH
jgi:hypothetical protein